MTRFLYLVRHGLADPHDGPLSAAGQQQARLTGKAPERTGARHATILPYGGYLTADGDEVIFRARAELRHLNRETAGRHYGEHVGKPFYDSLIDHITRSPVLLAVVEGPVGTWQVVRNTMGATNPAQAQPGTIRGDLALSMTENLIHGSDSAESAQREIALFFGSER